MGYMTDEDERIHKKLQERITTLEAQLAKLSTQAGCEIGQLQRRLAAETAARRNAEKALAEAQAHEREATEWIEQIATALGDKNSPRALECLLDTIDCLKEDLRATERDYAAETARADKQLEIALRTLRDIADPRWTMKNDKGAYMALPAAELRRMAGEALRKMGEKA